jgi:hypothetical protein
MDTYTESYPSKVSPINAKYSFLNHQVIILYRNDTENHYIFFVQEGNRE